MKTLKFKDNLVPLALNGSKTITWRINDDKDLRVGDMLLFINKDTGEEFGKAEIISIKAKQLGEVNENDYDEGHEKYKDKEDLLKHYRDYYGDSVSEETPLKIIGFTLVQ
jgi:hypothetical protein